MIVKERDRYPMKQYRKVLVLVSCMLSAVLFSCLQRYLVNGLSTQQIAKRWSAEEPFAQIACYFEKDAAVMPGQIPGIQRSLITALEEAAISGETENSGRNWVDAYSAQSKMTISSSHGTAEVRAFGVGGDFFQFHPLMLLSGNYFDNDDENSDGVILDELVAWQLFGANQVAGMKVEINGTVYPVRGVVRSDSGMFSEAAEEELPTIYISYDILAKEYEDSCPIDSYELLIADPVDDFGVTALTKALSLDEKSYEMVEVSDRYDLRHRFEVIKNFGERSMSRKQIVYPYWENRAKAYEDVSALLLILELACLCYPLIWVLNGIRKLYKNRRNIRQGCREKIKNCWQKLELLLKNSRKTYKLENRKK